MTHLLPSSLFILPPPYCPYISGNSHGFNDIMVRKLINLAVGRLDAEILCISASCVHCEFRVFFNKKWMCHKNMIKSVKMLKENAQKTNIIKEWVVLQLIAPILPAKDLRCFLFRKTQRGKFSLR